MVQIFQKSGTWLKGKGSIAIDPSRATKADLSIITHAHSDHVNIPKKIESSFLVTEGTHSLVKEKKGEKTKIIAKDYGKKKKVKDGSVRLESAGHILGSSQVVMETGKKIVFTSDFKLQNSLLFEGAKIIDSDLLVIESTFGLKEFDFPSREDVYNEMGKWLNENISKNRFVLLSGYSLGKAQELTRICSENKIEPLVNEKIFKFNNIYKRHKVKLGKYLLLDHNLKESNAMILPPNLVDPTLIHFLEKATGKKVASAVATGWNHKRFFNKTFNLSDHADFKDLMKYVQCSEPKMVLTHHGYAKQFAAQIRRKLKIPAKAIEENPQTSIHEF